MLNPAEDDSGVQFIFNNQRGYTSSRNDCDKKFPRLKAHWDNISDTNLNTTLSGEAGTVKTVEHLLSALVGMGVNNVLIETSGGEIPAMDGSARPFVEGIARAGRKPGKSTLKYLKVLCAVEVEEGEAVAGLYPSAELVYDCSIEFPQVHIGNQRVRIKMSAEKYAAEIAAARTFGFQEQLQQLKLSGRGLGASLHNAIGLGVNGEVLNDDGLRFPDELVRHKLLDAVGDLSLAGGPLLAEYRSFKPNHKLHQRLLQALFSDSSNYRWILRKEIY